MKLRAVVPLYAPAERAKTTAFDKVVHWMAGAGPRRRREAPATTAIDSAAPLSEPMVEAEPAEPRLPRALPPTEFLPTAPMVMRLEPEID